MKSPAPTSASGPDLRSRVLFVLYALGVVGILSIVTALIERAAP